jgi:hypothetical protein
MSESALAMEAAVSIDQDHGVAIVFEWHGYSTPALKGFPRKIRAYFWTNFCFICLLSGGLRVTTDLAAPCGCRFSHLTSYKELSNLLIPTINGTGTFSFRGFDPDDPMVTDPTQV